MKAYVKCTQTIRAFIMCTFNLDSNLGGGYYFWIKVLVAKIWSLGMSYGPLSHIRLLLGMKMTH